MDFFNLVCSKKNLSKSFGEQLLSLFEEESDSSRYGYEAKAHFDVWKEGFENKCAVKVPYQGKEGGWEKRESLTVDYGKLSPEWESIVYAIIC